MEIRRLGAIKKPRILRQSHTGTVPEPSASPQEARAGAYPPAAGFVRPLTEGDVPQIAELQERLMPRASHLTSEAVQEYFSRLMLRHPWYNELLTSLVYQEKGGRITGCLGVMPRPMIFEDRKINAAVSHSFMVEPGQRPVLAALELAQSFLAGPQDLSLSEAGQVSRKIWERAGGSVSLIHSLHWTRPLRPGRYALSFLRRRGLPPVLDRCMRPVCDLMDKLAPLASRSFRFETAGSPAMAAAAGIGTGLDGQTFCTGAVHSIRSRSLHPHYDAASAGWLLETLEHKVGRGDFHRVLVRNPKQETLGWYLYYVARDGIGAVVQIGAREGCAEQVFDHLCHHAAGQGAIAISGQVDPAFFHALAARDCLFHHDGGSSFLVHSRHPEILHAIHRGDAFLTRMEGEWWINFLLS
jgi:hypothetical protein